MGKIKGIKLTPMQRSALENGYRNGSSHAFRMRCKAVLLKAQCLSSPQIGDRLDMNRTTVNNWVNRFEAEGIKGLATRLGRGRKPIIGTQDGEIIRQAIEKDRSSILSAKAQWGAATGDGLRGDAQAFFKRIGARFGRIRKRPKGKPSPQLYRHKLGELQELERLWCKGSIDLYCGDESHICEQAYVPCGWKFPKEDIHVPSQRGARLNCFAMIDRHCRTHWFMTEKSIDADTMVGFLDNFSLGIASFCHRILRNLTSRRFFGGCSRENGFNQKKDYLTADTLFYAANRALAAMGDGLMINFKYHAA